MFEPKKIKNFTTAILAWKHMGSPLRSEDEVEQIESCCSRCPFLKSRRLCAHLDCCGSVTARQAYDNIIHMGTEACPIGKWRGQPGQLQVSE